MLLFTAAKIITSSGVSLCARKVVKETLDAVKYTDTSTFGEFTTAVGKAAVTYSLSGLAGRWAGKVVEDARIGFRTGRAIRELKSGTENLVKQIEEGKRIDEKEIEELFDKWTGALGMTVDQISKDYPIVKDLKTMSYQAIQKHNDTIVEVVE